jgi:hypothetical protein
MEERRSEATYWSLSTVSFEVLNVLHEIVRILEF